MVLFLPLFLPLFLRNIALSRFSGHMPPNPISPPLISQGERMCASYFLPQDGGRVVRVLYLDAVCHHPRPHRHQHFRGEASRGNSLAYGLGSMTRVNTKGNGNEKEG